VPNYDYRCERTGEMFEIWQAFSDDPLAVCTQVHSDDSEVCGSPVRKVFSKVGISFKGDGFYTNDHGARSKSTRPSPESSSDAAAADAGSDDKGSAGKGSGKADSTAPESGASGSDKPSSGSAKPKAGSSQGARAKDSTAA